MLLVSEKEQVILNFNDELKMYNKIQELELQIKNIHINFLEKEVL